MDKIESMTVEQEKLVIEFREEYRAIGLCCDPADRGRAEKAITQTYDALGVNRPSFFWFDGLMTAQLGMNMLRRDGVIHNLWDNLWANLWANLWDNLWANLRDNLRDNLRANLWDNLGDNLGANLRDNLRDNLQGTPELTCFATWSWGQMDAYWIAWYLFPHTHLREMHTQEQMEKLMLWDDIARSCCWWWPFENICIISERPLEIHMQNQRLHRDGAPAFVSRDGWKLWYLNGVQVSREIAETPSESLDPRLVLSETNAEVRREIVRKIGVERVLSTLGAEVADTSGDYSLVLLDLQDGRRRPYLKMLNPSIGTWHVEGIHPDCQTVEQAIAWRNGVEVGEQPLVLT